MTQEPKSMQPLDPDAGRIGELLRRDRPSPPPPFVGRWADTFGHSIRDGVRGPSA